MSAPHYVQPEPGTDGDGGLAPASRVLYEKNMVHDSTYSSDEKKEAYLTDAYPTDSNQDDAEVFDPFIPFNDLPEERGRIVTVRAVILGLICGTLVNASNVYLGLKSGWTFTANLFGAIVGFGVIKFLSTALPATFPILGGDFGPRENNIVQTVATAAGGMSNVFVSAYPALYQLKLLETPQQDYWRIVALTAVGGYFGFFFATPLRKFFIVYVARELRLVFPTATATAMTIRSMHAAVGGQELGKRKMRALGIAFIIALILRIVSVYAPGILWEWHIFTWFYIWGHYKNQALAVENWGWFIQFTPAFIGSGMLVGLNVSLSFYAGSILSWGIIGPLLVTTNTAFGKALAPKDPKWHPLVSFASFSKTFVTKDTPSPRYWLLWPGVLSMVAISFTELFLQWQIFVFAGKAVHRATCKALYDLQAKRGKENAYLRKVVNKPQSESDIVEDPAPAEEQVKPWIWMVGLLASIICICAVLGSLYDMPIGMSLLSVFLAFFFSFLAINCTGVTDITPLTAASKASQIVLGGATKSEGWQTARAEKLNLLGGALANIGANQSTDLVADFRVGFLLRTPPNQQWIGQAIGTVAAVFLAPLMFILFMKAYPCVIDTSIETCPFSYPSVAAWKAVAVAMVDPTFPIPKSSGYFAIIWSIITVIMVLIRHFLWRGKLEWVKAYHPNVMVISLSMVVPQTYYGLAMCLGSGVAHVWLKRNPKSFEIFAYAIAAGLIAGEGIGGTVLAILQVAGVSGDKYGSTVACPLECS